MKPALSNYNHIDFSVMTWEGTHKAQLKDFKYLPLSKKLRALQDMYYFVKSFRGKFAANKKNTGISAHAHPHKRG
jgi:hypothetical protein